jgi:hypothetical protein
MLLGAAIVVVAAWAWVHLDRRDLPGSLATALRGLTPVGIGRELRAEWLEVGEVPPRA